MNTCTPKTPELFLIPSETTAYRCGKRGLDLVVSFTGLLLLSPVLLVTALAVVLDSPGSALFHQTRVGKNGRLFRCWKFRSMAVDAESRKAALEVDNEMAGGVIFKMQNDPRITRVGRVIRSFSIDELPQLWNVLIGDMSLVGPRPPLPDEVAHYTACQRQRLAVTPGITCSWQVSGRSDIPFARQALMDLGYITRRGFWLDMLLLLRTVPAVLSARGAR